MSGEENSVDFWLGDRLEGAIVDFDGRLRTCGIVGPLHYIDETGTRQERRYVRLRVDPPLPTGQGSQADEVAIRERDPAADVESLRAEPQDREQGWQAVYICSITDRSRMAEGVVPPGGLVAEYSGQIARRPELLPPSHQEDFGAALRQLQKYAAREGHANVPLEHNEDGVNIGIWVGNVKWQHAKLGLRRDWEEQLESVPGWSWS